MRNNACIWSSALRRNMHRVQRKCPIDTGHFLTVKDDDASLRWDMRSALWCSMSLLFDSIIGALCFSKPYRREKFIQKGGDYTAPIPEENRVFSMRVSRKSGEGKLTENNKNCKISFLDWWESPIPIVQCQTHPIQDRCCRTSWSLFRYYWQKSGHDHRSCHTVRACTSVRVCIPSTALLPSEVQRDAIQESVSDHVCQLNMFRVFRNMLDNWSQKC